MMPKVAFITLTNNGYVKYTLNCVASLRRLGDKGKALAERLVCYSIGSECHERLLTSGCQSVLIDDEENSEFQLFRQGKWANVVAYKFEVISRSLQSSDFVCFTDGDIVYEDATFLDECIDKVASNDIELLIQNDTDAHSDADHANLCTGFMIIRSTKSTRWAFHPESVRPYVNSKFCDQLYVNNVIKKDLRVDVLPLAQYPNGHHFYEFSNRLNAKLIHFNYVVGHEKRNRMRMYGKWYLGPTETT